MKRGVDPLERLLSHVIPEPNSGCWLWDAADNGRGYGVAWYNGGMKPAHRVIYALLRRPLTPDIVLDHTCRVRSCVNPDHLRECTNRENIFAAGSLSPSKINSEKTHCPAGHEYNQENTRINVNGARECRRCCSRQSAEWARRKRASKDA